MTVSTLAMTNRPGVQFPSVEGWQAQPDGVVRSRAAGNHPLRKIHATGVLAAAMFLSAT